MINWRSRRAVRTLSALARYAPTRRLATVVVVTAPVWLLSSNPAGQLLSAVVIAILALATLTDALRIPGRNAVSLELAVAASVGLGERRCGTCEISSRWPAAFNAQLVWHSGPVIEIELPTGVLTIPAQSRVPLPVAVTGKKRGVSRIGPVALVITGPWGMVRRSQHYVPTATISVVPSIAGATRYRLLAAQHRARVTGPRVIQRTGAGVAFANLRDYAHGDDPRYIDWKATARRGRLISREFTVEQGQTIVIAIDSGRMMTQLSGAHERFEYALASALTLADVALTTGDRVGLIVFDAVIRRYLAPSRAPGTLTTIRDALAGITATMTEPDYAAAFRTLAERNRRRSLVVLFTDVIDARSSRAIISLTARAAERHLPLVVALCNEQLAAVAIPQNGATEQRTYESVAAEELLTARDGALQKMRQAGVAVLDTSPDAMTAALINRYLEIKQRSAL